MIDERKYFFVYTKPQWASAWQLQRQLKPVSSTHAAAPAIGTAKFEILYGAGYLPGGDGLFDGSSITSFRRQYVQILAADNEEGSNAAIWWTGVIPSEEFRLLGESIEAKSAVQTIKAYALGYLLDTRIDKAWVESSGQAAEIDHMPVFNRRVTGGGMAGNRSALKEEFGILPDSFFSYIFSADDGCGIWSVGNIIEYLFAHCQLPRDLGGPRFELRMPTPVMDALESMYGVYDFSSMTLKAAMDLLISRGRGFGWGSFVDGSDVPYVYIWSLLDAELTVGEITLPAHDPSDRTTIDLWTNAAHSGVSVRADTTEMFDKIVVRGARMKVCATFGVAEGTLEPAWTTGATSAYKDAAKNSTGYGALDNDDKAQRNDRYRASDKFSKVYTSFRVPPDWDWMIGNAFANPYFNPDQDLLDIEQQAGYWNGGKRFYPMLPFKEGIDYSGATPVDSNPASSEPELRKMFALVRNVDGTHVFVEQKLPASATVRPMSNEMGVEVKFRPRHLFAKNHFSGAEVSSVDDKMAEYACDYDGLLVTAMVETDQYVQLFHFGPPAETMRTMTIVVPDAELWYVAVDTVIDVDALGNVVEFNGRAGGIVRDDRDVLRGILAAAAAYYSKRRNKLTLSSSTIWPFVHIGQMIDNVDVEAGEQSAGTCVTQISITYAKSNRRMVVRTDHAELDLGDIHKSTGGGAQGIGSLKAASRKIAAISADIERIKQEQGKRPLRIETPLPESGGGEQGPPGTFEYVKVVRELLYDNPDRPYPTGCTWGTPDDPWPLEDQDFYIVRLETDSTAVYDEVTEYDTGDFALFEVLADSVTGEPFAEIGYGYLLKYKCNDDAVTGAFNENKWDLVDAYSEGQWKVLFPIGESSTVDMRDYIPWFELDDLLPIIKIADDYLFWQTFISVGTSTQQSLSWNADDKRAMAVYK